MSLTAPGIVDLFIIDDDLAILDSLRLGFTKEGWKVEAFGRAEIALEALSRGVRPKCILSDVRMKFMSGLEFQERLKQSHSAVPLILMTGHGQVQMAVSALKAGAFDFIEKPFEWSALLASVRNAMALAGRAQARQASAMEAQRRVLDLSERQRQVMDLAVLGYSNKEIAQKLQIGPRTVESYRASLMEKLGVANLAELVRLALQLQDR